MKTKKIFLIFFLLAMMFFFNNIYGQKSVIKLTFTAENNDVNVPLDSILITNLTQLGDTMLYASDTTLSLEYLGINEYNNTDKNSFSVSQNYPNPFKDQTSVNIYLKKKEHIKICVVDILSREVASYEKTLIRGNHSFTFYPGNEKYYLFSVTGNTYTKSIKMVNANSNNKKKCKIVYTGFDNNTSDFKSQIAVNNFVYNFGDELQFIGYSKTNEEIIGTSVINNVPQNDTTYVFNIMEGIPCPGIPIIIYEGQKYHTVLIGNQCWFKENLNIGKQINSSKNMTNNDTIEKYCYNNDEANCDTYGGLYQWDEMKQYSSTSILQGICPGGWHVPTDEEIKILEGTVDSEFGVGDPEWDKSIVFMGYDVGKKTKSTTGWYSNGSGTDDYGLRILPSGCCDNNGDFVGIGTGATFWTSSPIYKNSSAWTHSVSGNSDKASRYYYQHKYISFSVRCIKD